MENRVVGLGECKQTTVRDVTATMETSTSSTPCKRSRKVNWTPDETKFLVELYRENAKFLKGDFSSPGCTNRGKIDAWARIAASLHEAFPGGNRSVKDCQKRWQAVQSLSKTKIARYNEQMNKTGKNLAVLGVSGHTKLGLSIFLK